MKIGSSTSSSESSGSGSNLPIHIPQNQASLNLIPKDAEQGFLSTTSIPLDSKNSLTNMHNQFSAVSFNSQLQPTVSQVSNQSSLTSQRDTQEQHSNQEFQSQQQYYHTQQSTHQYFLSSIPVSQNLISKPVNTYFPYKNFPMVVNPIQQAYPAQSLPSEIHQSFAVSHQQQSEIQSQVVQTPDSKNLLANCIQRFNDYYINSNVHSHDVCKFSNLVLEYSKIYEPLTFALGNLGSKKLQIMQPDLTESFVDFKIKALHLLRQDLVYHGISESSLVCMLILGIIEMNEFNNEAWNQHLEGTANGITEMIHTNPSMMENLENFPKFITILETMARLDVMYAISTNSRPRLYKIYGHYQEKLCNTSLNNDNNDTSSINSPSALISMAINDLLCFASDLQDQFSGTMPELDAKYPEYYAVSKDYYSTDSHQRYASVLRNIENSFCIEEKDDTSLCTLGLASKQGILLYFILRLDANEFQTELSPKVRKIRDQGLSLISQEPLNFLNLKSHAVIIWLLGITAETKDDRNKLLKEMKQHYFSSPRSTFYLVEQFLTVFWSKRDSSEYMNYTYRTLLSVTTEETKFKLIF